MVPVARERSVLMHADQGRVSVEKVVNHSGIQVLSTTCGCFLTDVAYSENKVKATKLITHSRTLLLPSNTYIMVRTIVDARGLSPSLLLVTDPYFKRISACDPFDVVRVVTFDDNELFNHAAVNLSEMNPIDAAYYAKNFAVLGQSCPALAKSKHPLFFESRVGRPLPEFLSRRNTVWDRVVSASDTSLAAFVSLKADRSCGVFLDGVVVYVDTK